MSNNKMMDPITRMVNGPVNVIRLEGKIDDVNKVLYLFLDYHLPVAEQTQCENIFSQDVQKYFVNNFYRLSNNKSSNQMYDFFVEIYPTELATDSYRRDLTKREHKEKYIEEVVKIFRKIFRYDAKRNRVYVNDLFHNVRLHYLDIRDYYKYNVGYRINEMMNIARENVETDNIDPNGLDHIIYLMQVMREHLEYIIDILARQPSKRNVPTPKIIKQNSRSNLDTQAVEYLANKIKKSYNHPSVKKAMAELIDQSIDNFRLAITEIDEATERFTHYQQALASGLDHLIRDKNTSYVYSYGLSSYTMREMIFDIINSVERLIDQRFIEFFARFTDIYFLRRFLDKDYITNGIVYSGALHSNTYVHFLVNKFNFRVTHMSHSKIKDMTKLTNEIKHRNLMEIQDLVLPEEFVQCSDMNHFPQEFM